MLMFSLKIRFRSLFISFLMALAINHGFTQIAAMPWGMTVAKDVLPSDVFNYIKTKQVDKEVATKLNALFKNPDVQTAFRSLYSFGYPKTMSDEKAIHLLKRLGFTFLDDPMKTWVFKHISLPGKVFKLAKYPYARDAKSFEPLVGRIWFADYLRMLIPKLSYKTHFLIPDKKIHFMEKFSQNEFLAMIVVVDNIESKEARPLSTQEEIDRKNLKQRTKIGDLEQNIIACQPGVLAIIDTEGGWTEFKNVKRTLGIGLYARSTRIFAGAALALGVILWTNRTALTSLISSSFSI